jgi:hypothetical protein
MKSEPLAYYEKRIAEQRKKYQELQWGTPRMVSQIDGLRSDEGRLPSQLTQDTTHLAAEIARDRSRQEEQDKNTSLFGRAKSALSAIDRPISERLGWNVPEMRGPLDEILNIALQEGSRPTNYLAALAGGPAAAGVVRAGRGAKGAKLAAEFLQPVSRSRSPVARIGAEGAVVASGRAAGEGVQAVLPESTPTWARVGAGIGAGLVGGIGAAGAVGRAQRRGIQEADLAAADLTAPDPLRFETYTQRQELRRAQDEGLAPFDPYLEESVLDTGFRTTPLLDKLYGIKPIKAAVRGAAERFGSEGLAPFKMIRGEKVFDTRFEKVGDDPLVTTAFLAREAGRRNARSQGSAVGAKAKSIIANSGFDFDEKGRIPALAGRIPEIGAPTLRDVAARLPMYMPVLSQKQQESLGNLRELLTPYRQGWEEVSMVTRDLTGGAPKLEIGERGDVMPGGFYIPRGTADTADQRDMAMRYGKDRRRANSDVSEGTPWLKSSKFDSEAEGIAAGYDYTPIDDAMRLYVQGIGGETINQHTANYLLALEADSGQRIARLRDGDERGLKRYASGGIYDEISLRGLTEHSFPSEMAREATRFLAREQNINQAGAALASINAAFRGIQATGEMSYLGIQNAIGTVANPEAGLRAAKASTEAWTNAGDLTMGNYLIKFDQRAVADDLLTSEGWAAGGLQLGGARTEFQVGGLYGDIPGIGSLVKRADRGYGVAGDTMRLETANALLQDWKLRNPGRQVPDDIVKSIAESANRISGWTPQRAFGSFGEATQFAPRYLMARVRALGQLASTNPDKRAQAQSLVGKYLALMTTSTVALNELNGEETDFRPFSGKNGPTFNPLEAEYKNPNFMRVRNVAGRDFSLLGGMDALLGLQIGLMSIATNPTGDVREMISRSRSLLSSPIISTAIDWAIEGENFEGEKLTVDSRAGALDFARRIVPFAVPELTESAQAAIGMGLEGDPAGAAGETAAGLAQGFFGGRGTRQTIKERVERGDMDDFTPDEQFEAVRPLAWISIQENPAFKGLSAYGNFYQWFNANEDHFKSQLRGGKTPAGASLGEGQIGLEARKLVERSPVYKNYIKAKQRFETQWVINNPGAAMRKWNQSAALDPGDSRYWAPTKQQREIIIRTQGR